MKLSPEGQSLVEAGRTAFRPAAGDRERVLRGVQARIDAGGGTPDGSSTPPASGAAGLGWPAISALVIGATAAGVVAFSSLRPQEVPAAPRPPLPALSAQPPATPPATLDAREPTPSVPAAEPPAAAPAERSALPRRSDRLAEEVAILSRAETDLHAGRYTSALRTLDEHRRNFPNGALSQERMAARVRALCALGRKADAEAELGRLTRLSPNSPHEVRAREACASSAKKSP